MYIFVFLNAFILHIMQMSIKMIFELSYCSVFAFSEVQMYNVISLKQLELERNFFRTNSLQCLSFFEVTCLNFLLFVDNSIFMRPRILSTTVFDISHCTFFPLSEVQMYNVISLLGECRFFSRQILYNV